MAAMTSATDTPVSFSGRLNAHRRAVLFALGIVVLALVLGYGARAGWFSPSPPSDSLLVSGDIEAHESLLSFKTVQSRIVLLPFDEGATVKQGTVLARADDADYRQEVAIAAAALEVQIAPVRLHPADGTRDQADNPG